MKHFSLFAIYLSLLIVMKPAEGMDTNNNNSSDLFSYHAIRTREHIRYNPFARHALSIPVGALSKEETRFIKSKSRIIAVTVLPNYAQLKSGCTEQTLWYAPKNIFEQVTKYNVIYDHTKDLAVMKLHGVTELNGDKGPDKIVPIELPILDNNKQKNNTSLKKMGAPTVCLKWLPK